MADMPSRRFRSAWLVASNGRVVMALLAAFPVLPMCLLTRMRSVRFCLSL
jgi:hypothetical protein